MKKYNAIIVDDEPQAIELLVRHVNMLQKNIEILSTYTSWSKALEGLRTKIEDCDILFLDISINGRSGIDLLKIFPDIKSEVIFITAYSDFALNAIKFSPCGYLLKPIDEVELVLTLDKAITRIETKRMAKCASDNHFEERVGIFNNKGIDYVDIQDIIYFESVNQYTKIMTQKSEYISSYHLGKFSNITDRYPFFKAHRSYVINLKNILRYETSGIVIMSNKKEIPISRSQRNVFLKIFDAIH
ncbi:MAG: LytR/AlgR family response regulator transcription factor [Flavipsychrobacter sp.]